MQVLKPTYIICRSSPYCQFVIYYIYFVLHYFNLSFTEFMDIVLLFGFLWSGFQGYCFYHEYIFSNNDNYNIIILWLKFTFRAVVSAITLL